MFCTNFDIVIVGGGISGLFIAYKLCETNLNILLIEKDDRLGGRIHTIYKDGYNYECGAARFNQNHTKLISLIHDLDLEENIIKLPSNTDNKCREYKTDQKLNIQYLFTILKNAYKKYSNTFLQNITFFQLLVDVFDFETAEFIQDSFGYDSEFIHLNADAAMKMFKDDLFTNNNYYMLKNGLSEIIQSMECYLSFYDNIKIIKNNSLINIFDDKIITTIDTYYFKNLVLAIPQINLKKLDAFKDSKIINTVKPINLLRIYAKYPKRDGKIWFQNINRTTTNNYIRQIIPINKEKGLIMISYVDSIYAEMWSALYNNGKDALIKSLHNEIKKLFNITPPNPSDLFVHYWGNETPGVHMWKLGVDLNETYQKILQPDNKKNIFICGEAFSKKQCWIEGALETCYDVIKKLNLDGIEIFLDQEVEEVEEVEDEEEEQKINSEDILNTFTIDEVLENDKWIILEIDGKKNIYDVSKWIPHHPGGSAIMKGIEANKYYINNEGDSPMDLFNKIGDHHNNMVINNYLKKENEYVKLIGILEG